jgi:hypothetical protein
LDLGQIRQAWPLVRMAAPDVTLEQSDRYARALLERGGGLIGVFAGDSTLHGLATYVLDDDLRHGRTLRTDNIITFELNRSAPARHTLLEALCLIGEGFGCTAVVLTMSNRGYADSSSPKAACWQGLGLSLDAVMFARKINSDPMETAA